VRFETSMAKRVAYMYAFEEEEDGEDRPEYYGVRSNRTQPSPPLEYSHSSKRSVPYQSVRRSVPAPTQPSLPRWSVTGDYKRVVVEQPETQENARSSFKSQYSTSSSESTDSGYGSIAESSNYAHPTVVSSAQIKPKEGYQRLEREIKYAPLPSRYVLPKPSFNPGRAVICAPPPVNARPFYQSQSNLPNAPYRRGRLENMSIPEPLSSNETAVGNDNVNTSHPRDGRQRSYSNSKEPISGTTRRPSIIIDDSPWTPQNLLHQVTNLHLDETSKPKPFAPNGWEALCLKPEDGRIYSDSTKDWSASDGSSRYSQNNSIRERKKPNASPPYEPRLSPEASLTSSTLQLVRRIPSPDSRIRKFRYQPKVSDSIESKHTPEKSSDCSQETGSASSMDTDSSGVESWWTFGSAEEAPTLEPDHPFLRVENLALVLVLRTFRNWRDCAPGVSSQSGRGAPFDLNDNSSKKRQRAEERDQLTSLDIPDSQTSHKSSRKKRRTTDQKPTFACPFAKKDPVQYRDCFTYTLTRIRDVKQHLGRCHRRPIYCPICMAVFEDDLLRDAHVVAAACTTPQPGIRHEGITELQRLQLSKKPTGNPTHEAQWFTVFDILFPNHDPRPLSAYVDNDLFQNIALYNEFLQQNGRRFVSDFITQRGTIAWTLQNEERDLSAFLQRLWLEGHRQLFSEWISQGIPVTSHSQLSVSAGSSNSQSLHTPSSSTGSSRNRQHGESQQSRDLPFDRSGVELDHLHGGTDEDVVAGIDFRNFTTQDDDDQFMRLISEPTEGQGLLYYPT
jgi:hypothetical protein